MTIKQMYREVYRLIRIADLPGEQMGMELAVLIATKNIPAYVVKNALLSYLDRHNDIDPFCHPNDLKRRLLRKYKPCKDFSDIPF